MSDEPKDDDKNEAQNAADSAAGEGETVATGTGGPRDLMKRVEALAPEDEAERVARQEEEKLAERRKGRKDLETAASKRLAKIGSKEVKRAVVAKPLEDDPLLARAKGLQTWAKDNPGTARIGVAVVAIAIIGGSAFAYTSSKSKAGASETLTAALNADRGRIVAKDTPEDDDMAPKSPRPAFKTVEARRDDAMAKYEAVRSKYPGTGAAILARLAEGSLLLDKGDADAALAAYSDAKNSPLAQADKEVKGRALEGMGFAHELKAMANPADRVKEYDAAIEAYKELENSVEIKGFKELAMYHQGRCFEEKGDKDKAKELYKNARERITKPGEGHPFAYLEEAVTDRLRAIDPTAVPPKKEPAGMGGMPGGGMQGLPPGMDIEKLMKQFGGKMPGGPGGAPGGPGGAPH